MRLAIATLASALLLSCSPEARLSDGQEACLRKVEYSISTPSTLELIEAGSMWQFYYPEELDAEYPYKSEYSDEDAERPAYRVDEFEGRKGHWVQIDMIEYDAQNLQGALVREHKHCHSVELADGERFDLSPSYSLEGVDIPQERITVTRPYP